MEVKVVQRENKWTKFLFLFISFISYENDVQNLLSYNLIIFLQQKHSL